jgi:hypothetical protein
VDSHERQAVEAVLARIPREEWNSFLEIDAGRRFAARLETVRQTLHALGRAHQGAPPKPVTETIERLGYRLLTDKEANP